MRSSVAALAVLLTTSQIATAKPGPYAPLKPKAGATFNMMLSVEPSPSLADNPAYHVWDFDMENANGSLIDAFHAKGHPVICYFSAGTYEDWRADAHEFPKVALGKNLSHWAGEKWLNTSNPVVRKIMTQRIQSAADKGCDGVDPDNIDGYENDTGFALTKDQGVDYVQFLSKTANDAGLGYGLKNGGGILERVVDISDWCVNEQCVEYSECNIYRPFIKQDKPVFHIEYTAKSPAPKVFVTKSCDNKAARGFSTLIKHLSLNAWTTVCPGEDSADLK